MDKNQLLKFIEDNFKNIKEYQFKATIVSGAVIEMSDRITSWEDKPSTLKQYRYLRFNTKMDPLVACSLTRKEASDIIESIKGGKKI